LMDAADARLATQLDDVEGAVPLRASISAPVRVGLVVVQLLWKFIPGRCRGVEHVIVPLVGEHTQKQGGGFARAAVPVSRRPRIGGLPCLVG